MTKTAKIDTLFMTKTAENPTLCDHTYLQTQIREYPFPWARGSRVSRGSEFCWNPSIKFFPTREGITYVTKHSEMGLKCQVSSWKCALISYFTSSCWAMFHQTKIEISTSTLITITTILTITEKRIFHTCQPQKFEKRETLLWGDLLFFFFRFHSFI